MVDRNPNDAASRNNLAIFSLLLGKDKERAVNIASELYGKEPTNPVYASTYAFALFCTDKKPKAVEVMKGLKPEDLRTPSVAAYYSAFLAAVGRSDEAEEYRKLARGAVLLPEEERILNIVPVKEAPEATPAPAVVEVPVQATPAPAVVDVPVQATPAPAAVEVPVQATPAPAAVDVPVQATPAPAAVDVPVQATPTPAPAASPSTP